jgi:tRNA(Arg) A34 adenosine deaminase TadA
MTPEELMAVAVDKAREGIAAGQTPFGCAILLADGRVVAAHNRVWQTTDITAHAEVTALREACRVAGDVHLKGAQVATTCEPCPMCLAALHWAGVETVSYGATIADATRAGFNELSISAADMVRLGGSPLKLTSGILRDQCTALFTQWQSAKGESY